MEKIKDSIFKFLRLDNLVENLSGYFETRIELIKLEVREEIAKIIARGIIIGIFLLLTLLFLFFLSLGFAHYLNGYFNSTSVGFWVVAAIYGMPGVLIFSFRALISRFFEGYLMDQSKRKMK